MIVRFANVIFWICNILAVCSIFIGLMNIKNDDFSIIAGGVAAVVLYGIGRAVRYILAGR
jgi:hypothetical protein